MRKGEDRAKASVQRLSSPPPLSAEPQGTSQKHIWGRDSVSLGPKAAGAGAGWPG